MINSKQHGVQNSGPLGPVATGKQPTFRGHSARCAPFVDWTDVGVVGWGGGGGGGTPLSSFGKTTARKNYGFAIVNTKLSWHQQVR